MIYISLTVILTVEYGERIMSNPILSLIEMGVTAWGIIVALFILVIKSLTYGRLHGNIEKQTGSNHEKNKNDN